jgi:hypothetical protein
MAVLPILRSHHWYREEVTIETNLAKSGEYTGLLDTYVPVVHKPS